MITKKRWKTLVAVTVCICFVVGSFSGCGKKEITGEAIGAKNLASDVKDKYKDSGAYDYADPIKNINRDQALYMDIDVDPTTLGLKNYTEIVSIYQDPELTKEIPAYCDHAKKDNTYKISLKPPRNGVAAIDQVGLKDGELGYDKTEYSLFKDGDYTDWGNLDQFYMAQYRDSKTGEKLDKPIVTVITVKGELATPKVKYGQTDKGELQFSWNKVEGAKKYFLVRYDVEEKKPTRSGTVIAQTTETSWTAESEENFANKDFVTSKISEDEWKDPTIQNLHKEKEKLKDSDIPVQKENKYEYSVVAVNEKGTSMRGNTFTGEELAKRLPRQIAVYTGKDNLVSLASNISDAPAHRWVLLCDGTLTQKLINYEYDKAKVKKDQVLGKEDKKTGKVEAVQEDCLVIPYTVEGTPFYGSITVNDYDENKLKEDLTALEKRQDGLRSKSGSVDTDVEVKTEEEEESVETEEVDVKDYGVTANSALSEYLAINLVGSTEYIDLSDFGESSDQNLLLDSLMEAMYQNPMSLGIKDVFLSNDGKTLQIEYEDDKKTRDKKQEEIQAEVKKVIGEIIKGDMTDLEKELAINEYLCSTAKYDDAALKDAEKNDFKTVDEKYNDSFNAYGILVNKVGVCASYAASFKLLADAAGLETIVVTGDLNGSLPHAWNKVKINGKWQIVDVTNNDNEFIANAVLNLPDSEAGGTLVEDDRFAMDANIQDYVADSTEDEYYRVKKKYFDESQIAEKLAGDLKAEGKATLRTAYNIDDVAFNEIAQQAVNLSESSKEVRGIYWLGVIHISE